jgi:hypothetical protein
MGKRRAYTRPKNDLLRGFAQMNYRADKRP